MDSAREYSTSLQLIGHSPSATMHHRAQSLVSILVHVHGHHIAGTCVMLLLYASACGRGKTHSGGWGNGGKPIACVFAFW
mmetsp:Transcript_8702/g.23508  ORF Transcript_8702/g.23508 Transcript_8702/m.23508 type:complete len:80 (-) Transcript_8702:356-595(-)